MKNIYILLYIAVMTSFSCAKTYKEKLQESIDIINSESNYRYLALEEDNGLDPLPIVDDSIIGYITENKKFAVLEQLTISNAPKITAKGYGKLKKLKNLRLLSLKELPIDNTIVNTLFKDLDSIGSIRLNNIPNIDSIIINTQKNWLSVDIEECPKLSHIHLKNLQRLLSLTFDGVVSKNPLSIDIENSEAPVISFIQSKMVAPLKIKTDSSTYSLGFYRCDFTENALDYFSSFDQMQNLRIDNSSMKSLHINGLSKLEKVQIHASYDQNEKDSPLQEISLSDLPSLSEFSIQSNTLKSLNVKGVDSLKKAYISSIDKDFFIAGIDALESIEGFELHGTVFNDELLEKVTALPNLSYLGFHADTITKAQFASIRNSRGLKRINISPVKNDKELSDLLQIDGIEYLDINDADIKTISINAHPSLEVFTAKSCKNIENVKVANCQNLSDLYLDLSYPKNVMIQNIPNLKLLKLGLCKLDNRQEFMNDLTKINSLMYLSLEICNTDKVIDLRALDKLLYIPINNTANELILNKALEGKISTENYKGTIQYAE
ncbi:hypothetical protein [Aquimarina mytili]|uniref:Leucine-rich repeat domain-containing protein n=1 Tax=Aquimarina mytili TaxID=874423 RepID=A0A937A7B8_9FLAO|nr:hypothetical protein [Aquimarina mytili]MBL0685579.1 hypothetical protein [Aquimarina mytili]